MPNIDQSDFFHKVLMYKIFSFFIRDDLISTLGSFQRQLLSSIGNTGELQKSRKLL